jgi:hypothetical protein
MIEVTKEQAEKLNRLNIEINALLKSSAEEDYIDSGEAIELVQPSRSRRDLWKQ